MYVDSSPRVADVDFSNGTDPSGSSWHTIVVGGLAKGGSSYYALDLTDTTFPATETAAGAKVLWEWVNPDSDVTPGARLNAGGLPGFTYGHPVIVKVRESGYPTGRWVVLVTAGYNNQSGTGKIFVIDATNGKTLTTLTTTVADELGTPSNPSGLVQIHAFVRSELDQTIEQIYGADLLGNAWRWDVSARSVPTATPDYGANVYNGVGATKPTTVLFAQFKDSLGVAQPVTTAPRIEINLDNGIDRYVFFGTGRLLATDDLTNPLTPQQQTFYAIRDGTVTTVQTTGLPIQPRVTMAAANPDGVSAIVGGAPNGWYQDLPNNLSDPVLGAQRIIDDPTATVNITSWIGTAIQNDPCIISLPAYFYAKEYSLSKSVIDDGSGGTLPYLAFANGLLSAELVARIQPDGSYSLAALGSSPPAAGTQGITPINLTNVLTGPGMRWSWRLLSGE
jgi:type IV pilus assembly protein PilY1